MRNIFKICLLLNSFLGLVSFGKLAVYGDLHPMVAFFVQCAILFCTATLFKSLE